MRDLKFRYLYGIKDKPETYFYQIFTLDQIEGGDQFEVLSDMPMYRDHRVLARDQFIGLLDKNGKSIFEGDVLEIDDPEDKSTFEVVWQFSGWRKKFTDWPSDLPNYNAIDDLDIEVYAVIGNKWENPELLSTIEEEK